MRRRIALCGSCTLPFVPPALQWLSATSTTTFTYSRRFTASTSGSGSHDIRKTTLFHNPRVGGGLDVHNFVKHCSALGSGGDDGGATTYENVTVRGRVARVRSSGKNLLFLVLRQPPFGASIQAVVSSASTNENLTDAGANGSVISDLKRLLTPETLVSIRGHLVRTAAPVKSATCTQYELQVNADDPASVEVLGGKSALSPLPFPLQDANTKLDTRLDSRFLDLRTTLTAAVVQLNSEICAEFRRRLGALGFTEIHTPKLLAAASEGAGSAVFTVDYFTNSDKGDSGSAEAIVGRKAYLAQSPQLYKQMALNGDLCRVFELGPVFRAERSFTHRHLTEFTGLDGELVIHDSYTEVLDVLETVLVGMLQRVLVDCADTLARARAAMALLKGRKGDKDAVAGEFLVCEVSQDVVEKLKLGNDSVSGAAGEDTYGGRIGGATALPIPYDMTKTNGDGDLHSPPPPCVLRMSFDNAVRLLKEKVDPKRNKKLQIVNVDEDLEDFSLAQEREIGRLIRDRYGVDVYIIDQFPLRSRPFYTQPLHYGKTRGSEASHGEDGSQQQQPLPSRSCSYDMYIRGEEICSGAQRVNDPRLLRRRLAEVMAASRSSSGACSESEMAELLATSGFADYVTSFEYGSWPHGGFGLGLERILLFLLDASDIRQISLFPRDPKRLTP